jgi:C4-dicarboxylate-specific signal transduction histidine kinase
MTGLAVERGRAEEALRERRKREAELEEQLRQAAKMEALGVLAGGIAHDFNNLLATIRSNADLALMRLPANEPTRTMLDRIVVTSQRAGGFCSQMLAYSERGTMKKGQVGLGGGGCSPISGTSPMPRSRRRRPSNTRSTKSRSI